MIDGREEPLEISNMEEALEHLDNGFLGNPSRGDRISVKVLQILQDELLVEVGAKSEGIISSSELIRPVGEYAVGDTINGVVTYINEEEGRIQVSERSRAVRDAMKALQEAYHNQTKIEGTVKERVRGGYTVMAYDVVEAFLPGGQSMFKRNEDPINQKMDFEVIDFRQRRKRQTNIVLSRKTMFQEEIAQFFDSISAGQMIEGVVENIEDFGVFLNIGPISGLIPRSEISFDRDVDPKKRFRSGQNLKAEILNVDSEKHKVTLSLKSLQKDPWEEIDEKFQPGQIVEGEVIKILPFGFVVRIDSGMEGLVHASEIFWTRRRPDIRSVVHEEERVEVEILSIDKANRKISLSLKRVRGNPWEDATAKFSIGSVWDGKIVKILSTGLIVELEEGISGYVHVSEASWNFLDSLEEAFRVDDLVRVRVLEINPDQEKIRLSIRKAMEDPWKKVQEELQKGSVIQGHVLRVTESGAVCMLDVYGVEAFLPVSQISTERVERPADVLEAGDPIEAAVVRLIIEEDKDRRNMVISIKQLKQDQSNPSESHDEDDDYDQYLSPADSEMSLAEMVQEKQKEKEAKEKIQEQKAHERSEEKPSDLASESEQVSEDDQQPLDQTQQQG